MCLCNQKQGCARLTCVISQAIFICFGESSIVSFFRGSKWEMMNDHGVKWQLWMMWQLEMAPYVCSLSGERMVRASESDWRTFIHGSWQDSSLFSPESYNDQCFPGIVSLSTFKVRLVVPERSQVIMIKIVMDIVFYLKKKFQLWTSNTRMCPELHWTCHAEYWCMFFYSFFCKKNNTDVVFTFNGIISLAVCTARTQTMKVVASHSSQEKRRDSFPGIDLDRLPHHKSCNG